MNSNVLDKVREGSDLELMSHGEGNKLLAVVGKALPAT